MALVVDWWEMVGEWCDTSHHEPIKCIWRPGLRSGFGYEWITSWWR